MKPCWKGYKQLGMKKKNGKEVPNCIPEVTLNSYRSVKTLIEYINVIGHRIFEAEYDGRTVKLGKPMRGDVKKYKVYVKNPKTGKVIKVNFGDPNMEIKRDDPKRRKSFRARHKCSQNKDRTSAGYWSCRLWSTKKVSDIV